jgi:hypothetical protein
MGTYQSGRGTGTEISGTEGARGQYRRRLGALDEYAFSAAAVAASRGLHSYSQHSQGSIPHIVPVRHPLMFFAFCCGVLALLKGFVMQSFRVCIAIVFLHVLIHLLQCFSWQ